ncbi:MAG: (2Fe-2S)-binding protein [Candidatus Omnitrophota bacterium]
MSTLTINQKKYDADLQGHETLLEVLRDQLGLTGTKAGCQEAECGACTVHVNGKAVLSCITLAKDVEEEEITTIEGLAADENLHPVQQAFLDHGAVQCGFCTPGMVMAAKALLDHNPQSSEEEIKFALDGNLCRCTGYIKIIEAVKAASKTGKVIKKRK